MTTKTLDKLDLPLRDGVGASAIRLPQGPWPMLLDFLVARFESLDRPTIEDRLRQGDILDGFGRPVAPNRPYQAGETLFYYRHVEDEARIPFEAKVLFQDEHLVVADKPHFLPMSPVGRYVQETLLVRLKKLTGIATLAPMHRLDLETAGVVVFTVDAQARGRYQSLFASRAVRKAYEAIAPVHPHRDFPCSVALRIEADRHFMRMCVVDGAPNSLTRIELARRDGILGQFRLNAETGKKHQLRVVMAWLGMPILNDALYPEMTARFDYSRPLQLLAREIAFTDPLTGQERCFRSQRNLCMAA